MKLESFKNSKAVPIPSVKTGKPRGKLKSIRTVIKCGRGECCESTLEVIRLADSAEINGVLATTKRWKTIFRDLLK